MQHVHYNFKNYLPKDLGSKSNDDGLYWWQISDVLSDAGKPCGVRSVCIYGGTSKGPQISALKSGVVRFYSFFLTLNSNARYSCPQIIFSVSLTKLVLYKLIEEGYG